MASNDKWQQFIASVADPDNLTLADKKRWNTIVRANPTVMGANGLVSGNYVPFTNLENQETLETAEADYKTAVDKANAANEARYQAGLTKYSQAEKMYAPGGTFGAGYLAQLEKQKIKDVASGTQNLVSSGLANTTVRAGLPQAWEGDVGQPARLSLADLQATNYSNALANTANYMERKTEAIPDMTLYANLLQTASVGSPTGTTGSGTYSAVNYATPTSYSATTSPSTITATNPTSTWYADFVAKQSAAIAAKAQAANNALANAKSVANKNYIQNTIPWYYPTQYKSYYA